MDEINEQLENISMMLEQNKINPMSFAIGLIRSDLAIVLCDIVHFYSENEQEIPNFRRHQLNNAVNHLEHNDLWACFSAAQRSIEDAVNFNTENNFSDEVNMMTANDLLVRIHAR